MSEEKKTCKEVNDSILSGVTRLYFVNNEDCKITDEGLSFDPDKAIIIDPRNINDAQDQGPQFVISPPE